MPSKGCQHAIRALAYLTGTQDDGPQPIHDVAAHLDIPYPFLARVVQDLSKRDLVDARKGPGGGIQLGRSSAEISLREVVEAVDGPQSLKQCVLGLPDCGDGNTCPLHNSWLHVREDILGMLDDARLSKLGDAAPDH